MDALAGGLDLPRRGLFLGLGDHTTQERGAARRYAESECRAERVTSSLNRLVRRPIVLLATSAFRVWGVLPRVIAYKLCPVVV